MAEGIRAQIATPRAGMVSFDEQQQQIAQHQRYTNIVSQSRARRQVGGSFGPKNNSLALSTNNAVN
jgi:hypothetical protein